MCTFRAARHGRRRFSTAYLWQWAFEKRESIDEVPHEILLGSTNDFGHPGGQHHGNHEEGASFLASRIVHSS
jgi:hypothetical protein